MKKDKQDLTKHIFISLQPKSLKNHLLDKQIEILNNYNYENYQIILSFSN